MGSLVHVHQLYFTTSVIIFLIAKKNCFPHENTKTWNSNIIFRISYFVNNLRKGRFRKNIFCIKLNWRGGGWGDGGGRIEKIWSLSMKGADNERWRGRRGGGRGGGASERGYVPHLILEDLPSCSIKGQILIQPFFPFIYTLSTFSQKKFHVFFP